MLHTNGFLSVGLLTAVITLTASWAVLDRAAAAEHDLTPSRPAPEPLGDGDLTALRQLSDALDGHTVPRHRIGEPDAAIAEHAQRAALTAGEALRVRLLGLAESARRSALAFLVDYNLAAGVWERTAGFSMRQPALAR